jgi:hypothetical protein
MDSKITRALVWKEVRFNLPTIIMFYILSFLLILSIHYHVKGHPNTPVDKVHMYFNYILYSLSLFLVFFFGASNRVLETINHFDPYMFVKPVEKKQLFIVYYWVGIVNYIVWLIVFYLILICFFGWRYSTITGTTNGMEIFPESIQYYNFGWNIGYFLINYFISYTIVFSLTILNPKIVLSIVTSILSYCLLPLFYDLMTRFPKRWEIQYVVEYYYPFVWMIGIIILLILVSIITVVSYTQYKKFNTIST